MAPAAPRACDAAGSMWSRAALRALLVPLLAGALMLAASARAEEGEVTILTAVEVPVDDGPLYRVTYSYSFPSRQTVYIDGLGTVSGHGRFTYLESSPSVRILDRYGGEVLRMVAIGDPVRLMGKNIGDLPLESGFPEAYRQGRWRGERPFAEVALAVLDRFFPSGYRAYRRAERQYYLTMFQPLSIEDERVRAQVAVLLSMPADIARHSVEFTLQVTARERRSHSSWRSELSDTTRATVLSFVNDVLSELESGGSLP